MEVGSSYLDDEPKKPEKLSLIKAFSLDQFTQEKPRQLEKEELEKLLRLYEKEAKVTLFNTQLIEFFTSVGGRREKISLFAFNGGMVMQARYGTAEDGFPLLHTASIVPDPKNTENYIVDAIKEPMPRSHWDVS